MPERSGFGGSCSPYERIFIDTRSTAVSTATIMATTRSGLEESCFMRGRPFVRSALKHMIIHGRTSRIGELRSGEWRYENAVACPSNRAEPSIAAEISITADRRAMNSFGYRIGANKHVSSTGRSAAGHRGYGTDVVHSSAAPAEIAMHPRPLSSSPRTTDSPPAAKETNTVERRPHRTSSLPAEPSCK
jgi:hypothetical protein